jgi:hypothetical protein
MLLLPAAKAPDAGPLLALVSTLAGNLLIVGSIANIIVVDAARKRGITIDWAAPRAHRRAGDAGLAGAGGGLDGVLTVRAPCCRSAGRTSGR